jgi:hypothetical protein
VWVRDDGDNAGYVFDSETGRIVSSFDTDASKDAAPAVGAGVALFMHAAVLRATDENSGRTLWTFSGDGTLAGAPLIAGDLAYVGGQSGRVYAVRLSDGQESWHGDMGAPARGTEHGDNTAIPGLAAADGVLAVPATGRLAAFGRPESPASRSRARGGAHPFTVTMRVRRARLASALRRGVRVWLRCSAPCRIALRASKARRARRFHKQAPKGRASMVVRLARAARHARRLRLRLVASATELHGTRKAAASKQVTISR